MSEWPELEREVATACKNTSTCTYEAYVQIPGSNVKLYIYNDIISTSECNCLKYTHIYGS